MKTQKQIKQKLIELMAKMNDAEMCIKGKYNNSIFTNYSDYRHCKSEITTLMWVLGSKETHEGGLPQRRKS